jgi:hydrolase, P-loop family
MNIAKSLASSLKPGTVIALDGELGAGKTVFVKGIAMGLGIFENITSPTFTIVKEYSGRLKLYHFDVYRIEDSSELFEIGFDEYINGEGVSVIEWAVNIEDTLPSDTIYINIEGSGYSQRKIEIGGNAN